MPEPATPHQLEDAALPRLAAGLEERPETAAVLHLLARGICRAWCNGPPESPDAIVVQADPYPEEPFAYGSAEGIGSLLREVEGWTCVNVAPETAEPLQTYIDRQTHILGDLYYTTATRPTCPVPPQIRALQPPDEKLLVAAPVEIRGGGYESTAAMLCDGFCAGAVVDDKLVGIANLSVLTPRYGEPSVATLEPWRRRGFATGAASLVVSWILDSGRTAVWSCGEHNEASIASARKLGFRDAGRRAYVVLSARA